MTHPTDEELDALVELAEKFVTATWHLLDNSETSGPIDDPTIAVWQPDFDEVSALLDRCEGLPSGSTEHMTAGELLSANMTAAITALRAQLAEVQAEKERLGREVNTARYGQPDFSWQLHKEALAEANARADRAEAALAALMWAADQLDDCHILSAAVRTGYETPEDRIAALDRVAAAAVKSFCGARDETEALKMALRHAEDRIEAARSRIVMVRTQIEDRAAQGTAIRSA